MLARRGRAIAAGLAVWLTITPALGQNQGVRSAHAIEAIDGHSIKLDDEILVLAGIAVPLASDGAYAQRWADQARRKLHQLAAGRTLTLAAADSGHDRYWRVLAQATDDKGVWLQGELLRAGLARVWLPSATPDRLEEMLALERQARAAKRGLWGDAFFAVLGADSTDRRHLDRLQLVEGQVRAVATVRGTTYINFGEDWRSDFTVELDAPTRRAFVKAGLDPAGFKDRKLRVRGWLSWHNGPAIDVKYVSQIEVLD